MEAMVRYELERAIVLAARARGRLDALRTDLRVCSFDELTVRELVDFATFYGVPASVIVAICVPV